MELNEKFSTMAAAFAHEVKSPVALIKANMELIEESNCADKCSHSINVIKNQLSKITSIVTDFTRLVESDKGGDMEQIFIYDLLSEITEEYKLSIPNNALKFSIYAENKDISLFFDYTKLYILFSNVYKNAAEAMENTGTVETEIIYDEQNIYVTIIDSGTGLSEYVQQRLYEPFVTTKKDGSGLGLAICKSIAEEYSGSFEIKNSEKGGCVVKVILKK